MEPVLCQALRTFVPYSQRHGYELRIGTGESLGRPAAWAKVPFIQRLLGEYQEVLWLDADVVILDLAEDLADHVEPDAYQALVENRVGDRTWVNTGVWFLRADERTDRFLQAVWDSTDYIDHPWWENTPVLEMLGYNIGGLGSRRVTSWSEGTQILPEEWNVQVDTHGMQRARIRHYSAQTNDRREQWMRADADRASGHPAWVMGASKRWAVRHLPRSPGDLFGRVRRRALVAVNRSTV
jgi:galactosyl transferase GMA12/MNN10 family